jgi:hypothetical protein
MQLFILPKEPRAGLYGSRIYCGGRPTFSGDRHGSLACGACGLVLAEGVDPADFANVAFRCRCGTWGAVIARD